MKAKRLTLLKKLNKGLKKFLNINNGNQKIPIIVKGCQH